MIFLYTIGSVEEPSLANKFDIDNKTVSQYLVGKHKHPALRAEATCSLTADELAPLPTARARSAQWAWAKKLGWVTDDRMRDADGRPLILRGVLRQAGSSRPGRSPTSERCVGA